MPRIHFVSLGCPKNRVDSEVMLGLAETEGFRHVADPSEAEVIVVNTCGFIESAKQESIDTILELAEQKHSGRCQKLVVTGCLSQRHGPELAEGLPEVDHFLGSSDMMRLVDVLRGSAARVQVGNPADWVMHATDPRRVSTRGASAYLKIAEGCNRNCSFCVIPSLRGKQRSRPPEDIVLEAQRLASAGVLELNLVSQDTIAYGRDSGKGTLPELLRQVADVDGLRWVRLFYLYPEKMDDELIDSIASHEKIVPYVDMPLQHAAPQMLKRMRRGGTALRPLVERLRSRIDGLVFRTAFVVGHPGETDAEFEELCDFVRWAKFDHVGVFTYSDEETSHSNTLPDKVPAALAAERADALMALQREISRGNNERRVGQQVEILVEGPSEESELVMVGRHRGQAPDIDGVVYVSGGPVRPGRIYPGVVESATDYDLVVDVGELDDDQEPELSVKQASVSPILQRHTDGRRSLRTV